jgi:hypothetical protein
MFNFCISNLSLNSIILAKMMDRYIKNSIMVNVRTMACVNKSTLVEEETYNRCVSRFLQCE